MSALRFLINHLRLRYLDHLIACIESTPPMGVCRDPEGRYQRDLADAQRRRTIVARRLAH